MANPVPAVFFPGISLSANNEIVFTTSNVSPGPATFPELSNAEADPSSGDIRDMAYAILSRIASASPSPPLQFSSQSSSLANSEFPNYIRNIDLTFSLEASGTEELLDEPS